MHREACSEVESEVVSLEGVEWDTLQNMIIKWNGVFEGMALRAEMRKKAFV